MKVEIALVTGNQRLVRISTFTSHNRELCIIGLSRPWRFYVKAVSSASWNVCFRKFLGGANDTLLTLANVRYPANNFVGLISPNDRFETADLLKSRRSICKNPRVIKFHWLVLPSPLIRYIRRKLIGHINIR